MTLITSQLTDAQAKILGAVAHRPGTLIWMGLLMIVLGSVGVFAETFFSIASISLMGGFALAAGIMQALHALQARGWKSVSIQQVFALIYVAIGVIVWVSPVAALEGVTLYMATLLFATGGLRLVTAFQHTQFSGWFLPLVSAALSILLGGLILAGWPDNSVWVPGMLIGIELLLQGWSLFFLGLAAKNAVK
ncbi:MAG: HdeD family acid-resistance protein [Fluviibacter sp.]